MKENEIYEKFMAWLKTAPMSFTDSDDMTALIQGPVYPGRRGPVDRCPL